VALATGPNDEEEVVSIMPCPLYPQLKCSQYFFVRSFSGLQRKSGCFTEEKNLLALAELELPTVQPIA